MKKVKVIIRILCFTAMYLFSFVLISQTDTLVKTDTLMKTDTTELTEYERALFGNDSLVFKVDSLDEVILTEAEMADFTDKAIRKTKALSNYISTIASKSKDDSDRDNAMDQAVNLFLNEDCIVEVSSLNNEDINRYKIRSYLRKLKHLHYDKVAITWYKIYYASNFKLRPDGKYEAVASIFQKFSGETKEGVIYEDKTKKSILIIIDRVQIPNGPGNKTYWEVFLGDIKVEETSQM